MRNRWIIAGLLVTGGFLANPVSDRARAQQLPGDVPGHNEATTTWRSTAPPGGGLDASLHRPRPRPGLGCLRERGLPGLGAYRHVPARWLRHICRFEGVYLSMKRAVGDQDIAFRGITINFGGAGGAGLPNFESGAFVGSGN